MYEASSVMEMGRGGLDEVSAGRAASSNRVTTSGDSSSTATPSPPLGPATVQGTPMLVLYTRPKAVFDRRQDVAKDQNTRNNLIWTAEKRNPMHEVCIPHKILRAWEQ